MKRTVALISFLAAMAVMLSGCSVQDVIIAQSRAAEAHYGTATPQEEPKAAATAQISEETEEPEHSEVAVQIAQRDADISSAAEETVTEAPVTEVPVTEAPVSEAPAVEAPAAEPAETVDVRPTLVILTVAPTAVPAATATAAPTSAPTPTPIMGWTCPGCGRNNPEDNLYCGSCGRIRPGMETPTPAPTPTPTSTPVPTATPTSTPAPTPVVTATPRPAATPTPKPVLPTAGGNTLYVSYCDAYITLRSSASTSGAQITTISLGQTVTWDGTTVVNGDGEFSYVRYSGHDGWVLTKYLATAQELWVKPGTVTTVYNVDYNASLRCANDSSSAVITVIPKYDSVNVIGVCGYMTYVEYNGMRGYVVTKVLRSN